MVSKGSRLWSSVTGQACGYEALRELFQAKIQAMFPRFHCKWDTLSCREITRKKRDVEPMLVQCWPIVCDAGQTLNQHWLNVSFLLGYGHCGLVQRIKHFVKRNPLVASLHPHTKTQVIVNIYTSITRALKYPFLF